MGPDEFKRLFRQLAAHTPDVIYVFTANWGVIFVNDAYEEILGRPVEAIEGDALDFLEGIPPAIGRRFGTPWSGSRDDRRPVRRRRVGDRQRPRG